MKKKICSLVLCLTLFLSNTAFLQTAEGAVGTNSGDSGTDSGQLREIPQNPTRPNTAEDTWNGDYVYFGKYLEQPLKWRVLKNDGKNLLLMTNSGVGCFPYQNVDRLGEFNNTWENSTIREYLNSEFITDTFTPEEQEYLQVNHVRNGYSGSENFDSGNDTEDKAYLLSASELKRESYGFYGGTEAANSRRFSYEAFGEDVYEEVWTRTLWGLTYGNPYAYWIDTTGEYCARGAWFTHPVTWSKHIHPVIKISIDCPFWRSEAQQEEPDNEEGKGDAANPGGTSGTGTEMSIQGLNFKVKLPEEVPIIGGTEVGIDLMKVPVLFSVKDNQYRIVIGAEYKSKGENLWDLEKDEWNLVKKWKESQDNLKKNILDGVQLLKDRGKEGYIATPFKASTKASVRGYAEGTLENGAVQNADGGISIEMKMKVEENWQTFLFSFPVVIKFSGEIGAKEELGIAVDFANGSICVDGELSVSLPKDRVSFGTGIAYIADVSAYGEIENNIKIKSKEENTISAKVKGALGISVKALCFSAEWKWKEINNGEGWEYWNSKEGFLPHASNSKERIGSAEGRTWFANSENYNMERNAQAEQDWYPAEPGLDSEAVSGEQTVRTEIYDAPEIKTVRTDDGTLMMVYVENIRERTDGNHTAVVYSLYDPDTGRWNEPQILQDDGTADFYPEAATDGTNIYVAWTNANRQFSLGEADLPSMAQACDICVAEYHTDTGTFTVNTLTENNQMDIKPVLGNAGESISVAWLQNSESDILNFAGTNSVYYSIREEGGWSEPVEYAAYGDRVITSLAIGSIGGNPSLAFTADMDRDYFTTDDVELYLGKLVEEPQALQVDNEAKQGLQFAKLGDKEALVWYGDGVLAYTTDLVNDYTLMQSGQLNEKYQIVSDGTDEIIFFAAADSDTETGTGVYAAVGNGSKFSRPVQVTEGGTYVNGFSGWKDETGYQLLFGKEQVEIGEDEINKEVSLCQKALQPSCKLALKNVEFQEEEVRPGGKLKVQLDLFNQGLSGIKEIKIAALCNHEPIYEANQKAEIDIGYQKKVEVALPLPEDLAANSILQMVVQPVSQDGEETVAAAMEVMIGKSDFSVYADTDGQKENITLEVVNEGNFTGSGTLTVKAGEGNILKEISFRDLEPGGTYAEKLKKSDILKQFPGEKMLYVSVKAEGEEIYYSNNQTYCYIGDTEAEPEPPQADDEDQEEEDEDSGNGGGSGNESGPGNINDSAHKDTEEKNPADAKGKTPHKISGKASYQKTYNGNGGFYLNVSSPTKAKLTYASSNTRIVGVDDSGYVSIKGIGKSTITVTAKKSGNYTETKMKVSVTVKPAKSRLYRAVSPSGKKVKLNWSKCQKAGGYQVRYSMKKSMKSSRTKKASGAGKTSMALKGLKKGKKYYFQVRAYKKVGKKVYYGAWSNKKSVKVRSK